MKHIIVTFVCASLFSISLSAQQAGITLGNSTDTTNGTIRYNSSGFEGMHLGNWIPFSANSGTSLWTPMSTNIYFATGRVGVGTTTPETRFHINGGTDANAATGSYLQLGNLAGINLGIDNNEIQARNDGIGSTLYIQKDAGNLSLTAGTGNVGIGINGPTTKLHVVGAENNGSGASVTISSGIQNMTIDGNEIDSDEVIGLYLNNNTSNNVILSNGGGNVGVGVLLPEVRLHVAGNAKLNGGTLQFGGDNSLRASGNALFFTSNAGASQLLFRDVDDNAIGGIFGNNQGVQFGLRDKNLEWIIRSQLDAFTDFYVSGTRVMRAREDGKIAIGAVPNYPGDYSLYVETGVLTERVKIATIGSSDWADYVFAEDYDLKSLPQIDQFVKEHKHLPNIPSASEVEQNGYELQLMDAKLLEKIEELYLHSIALEKENSSLENKVDQLIKRIEQLENK